MKKQFTLFSLLAVTVFILASMSYDENQKTMQKNYIFSMFNDEPVLPSTPFEYENISFPGHIKFDTIETGYDGEPIDTTILDLVDDDISTLGRVLFYDKTLSAMENISCASCHEQEFSFAQPEQFSEGISSLTTRNSMQLNDLGWSNNDGFFWDMSFSNLADMINLPLKDENEIGAVMEDVVVKMNATNYYPELFEKAFGSSAINEDRIVAAIGNFISSMVSFDSRFDQQADLGFAGFTESETRGLEVFQLNCATCHKEGSFDLFNNFDESNQIVLELPFLFTNGLDANPDDIGAGEWASGFDGLYKLPTMRNIGVTAPYMHNGSLETLDDVIEFYSEDVVDTEWGFLIPPGGFQFTDTQKADLKAFLLTLTDETFLTDEKFSDPFDAVINNNLAQEFIQVSISPNPMSTYAVIELENEANEVIKMELYNEVGQLVTSDTFKGNTYQLDKNALAVGLYSVRLQGETKSKTIKLIVQ